jgi:hypothetical protein
LSVTGSTINDNEARFGGGIWTRDDDVSVVNNTISRNTAGFAGGGLFWFPFDATAVAAVRHSTIVGNSSDILGGGIFVSASQLTLDHTILATNTAMIGPDLTGIIGGGFDARFSLIGNRSNSALSEAPPGAPDANGNIVGGPVNGPIDPKLGPLAANGGPTFTHALLPKSPALDTGDPAAIAGVAGVPIYDQRGAPFARVFDGVAGGGKRIDIGAFELPPSSPAAFGDYDRNGIADAADYVVWRRSLGAMVAPYEGADGDGSGLIDDADHAVWRAHFGLVPGPFAPEDTPPMPDPPEAMQAAALLEGVPTPVPESRTPERAKPRPDARPTVRPAAISSAHDSRLRLSLTQFTESPRRDENPHSEQTSASTQNDVAARDTVFQSWAADELALDKLREPLPSCRFGENQ